MLSLNRTKLKNKKLLIHAHDAIIKKDIESVQKCLKKIFNKPKQECQTLLNQPIPVKVCGPFSKGNTLLHACIQNGIGLPIIDDLLINGADLNQKNEVGEAPLHSAVRYGNLRVAKLLLHYGADVNLANGKMNTPLLLALNLHNTFSGTIKTNRGDVYRMPFSAHLWIPLFMSQNIDVNVSNGANQTVKSLIEADPNLKKTYEDALRAQQTHIQRQVLAKRKEKQQKFLKVNNENYSNSHTHLPVELCDMIFKIQLENPPSDLLVQDARNIAFAQMKAKNARLPKKFYSQQHLDTHEHSRSKEYKPKM